VRAAQEDLMATGPGEWVPKSSFVLPVLPEELQIDPLLLALLHVDAFLQLSEDEAVDPDAAVEASEHVGHYLRRLPADRVAAIKKSLKQVAVHGRKQKWPTEVVEFFAEYWENAVGDDE
jgi:hypothetical protein